MDEVKKRPHLLSNVNLKLSFFIYVAGFFLIAVLLSAITIAAVDTFVSTVAVYYINTNEDIDRINEDTNEDIQIAVKMIDKDFNDVKSSAILFYARNFYVAVLLALYFIVGIILASRAYYRRKIGVPLEHLMSAAHEISEKNLDFKIDYRSDDEMGRLCDSFETMRKQLYDNNRELWKVIDEQKRVQRAFSHDIRTPLTITMGYVDLLRDYLPEGKVSQQKLIDTIELIGNNLVRLENFVSVMSNMQRLNDIEPKLTEHSVSELFNSIRSDAKMICWDTTFFFDSRSDCEYVTTDSAILQQIVMNLVSNASRYAKSKVEMTCVCENGKIEILVRDDGDGFSEQALKQAAQLYYSDADGDGGLHFGIGLNICKLLCDKLGGEFMYYNDAGACVRVTL